FRSPGGVEVVELSVAAHRLVDDDVGGLDGGRLGDEGEKLDERFRLEIGAAMDEAKRSFAPDLSPEAKKRRGHRRLTARENNMILDPARRRRLIEVPAARFDRVRLEIA